MQDEDKDTDVIEGPNESEAYAEPLRMYLRAQSQSMREQNQIARTQASYLQEIVQQEQGNSWAPIVAMGLALAAALGALALGSKELATVFAAGGFGLPAFAGKIRRRKK